MKRRERLLAISELNTACAVVADPEKKSRTISSSSVHASINTCIRLIGFAYSKYETPLNKLEKSWTPVLVDTSVNKSFNVVRSKSLTFVNTFAASASVCSKCKFCHSASTLVRLHLKAWNLCSPSLFLCGDILINPSGKASFKSRVNTSPVTGFQPMSNIRLGLVSSLKAELEL